VALRRLRLDILHVHHVPLWLRIRRAAKWAGVSRIVLTEHAKFSISRSPVLQEACRRAAEAVSCFTVVSEDLKDYFVSELGVSAERLRVVRNGVDTRRFHPGERGEALRGLLPAGYTGPVAITVGRLTEAKDHGNLLEAWSLLEREGRAPYLLIVGDGELRDAVERQVAAQSLGATVRLVGARSDIDTLLRGSDIFIVSSRREGLPLALLEAMASGVPVVATRVGGIPEVLSDGHNGILVPPESPAALAAAVRDLLADGPQRQRLAASGRSSVAEAWSLDRMAACYAEVYATCVSSSPA
jgi:glycosyltransferase involved in cell wall biosynthesis